MHDNPNCPMCGRLRRGIWKMGHCWRICSTCDEGLGVARNDNDGATPPEADAAV